MSLSRRNVFLALLALSALGVSPVLAQRVPIQRGPTPITPIPVNPNAFLGGPRTAQQFLFNSAVVGRGIRNIPPYAFGFNPFPAPIINTAPVINTGPFTPFPVSPVSPFALSTVPAPINYPASATLSTSPYSGYSLSTTGSSYGNNNSYNNGYYPPYYQDPFGATLQGAASYTQAYGQYLINTQQARLIREQARQATIDTNRKAVQYEAWYEKMRLTANQVRAKERATDLEGARIASPSEIYSGRALNELLRSVQDTAGKTNLNRGPQIDLTDIKLENIHLTDKSGGSAGLLRGQGQDGKLTMNWPAAMDGKAYTEPKERLTENLREAVAKLRKSERPTPAMLRDIESDVKTINNKLNERDTADELSPSQFIEARRFMNQVEQAVKALRSPNAANHFNDTWKPQGRTVSELVDNLSKNGLSFASATPGDEAAYTALYQALRAFEGGLQTAMNQK
jgi:hypothetical protein